MVESPSQQLMSKQRMSIHEKQQTLFSAPTPTSGKLRQGVD
jgi:hypothetical protein